MKTLLVSLCAVAASSVAGGSEDSRAATNATVINESLPVYSQMSRSSKVVRLLKKGDKVTVDLALSGAGEAWCSLTGLGGSGGTGYVQCKGVERAPRAPVPAGPLAQVIEIGRGQASGRFRTTFAGSRRRRDSRAGRVRLHRILP